jgi:hypothetical protein
MMRMYKSVSYSCVRDYGTPLEIGFQEQVSNPSKLLRSKVVVVSVGGKARGQPEQVWRSEAAFEKSLRHLAG